jgi:GT2 family glycosyltransferase
MTSDRRASFVWSPLFSNPLYRWRVADVILDATLVAICFFGAHVLRFGGTVPENVMQDTVNLLPVVIASCLFANVLGGVYRCRWRLISLVDLPRFAASVLGGTLLSLALVTLNTRSEHGHSFSAYLIFAVLFFLALAGSRLSLQLLDLLLLRHDSGTGCKTRTPVLIYGAGGAGKLLYEAILCNPEISQQYRVVGFIDESHEQAGSWLCGMPIRNGAEWVQQPWDCLPELWVSSPSISDAQARTLARRWSEGRETVTVRRLRMRMAPVLGPDGVKPGGTEEFPIVNRGDWVQETPQRVVFAESAEDAERSAYRQRQGSLSSGESAAEPMASGSGQAVATVSVVIVSYNVREHLRESLQSVYAGKEHQSVEVWVVDNASHDGSSDMVRREFPEVRLIENLQNFGLARAANQAIEQSSGEFIVLLNPDARLVGNGLNAMVAFLKEHPDVGIVGGAVLNPDGTRDLASHRGRMTPFAMVAKAIGLDRLCLRSLVLAQYNMRCLLADEDADVVAVSGSFLTIRRQVIRQIGLMDERFFMYWEDYDWCLRAGAAGWGVCYCPRAQVMHEKGASSRQDPSKARLFFYQSYLVLYEKQWAKADFLLKRWLVSFLVFAHSGFDTRLFLTSPPPDHAQTSARDVCSRTSV